MKVFMILEDISVTILAKNSEKYLKEVLRALAPLWRGGFVRYRIQRHHH